MKLVIEVNKEDYKRYKEDKVCSYASAVLDAVPLNEVLDEIRAEIDAHRKTIKDMANTDDWYAGKLRGHDCDIEIIDKYRAESEEQE